MSGLDLFTPRLAHFNLLSLPFILTGSLTLFSDSQSLLDLVAHLGRLKVLIIKSYPTLLPPHEL